MDKRAIFIISAIIIVLIAVAVILGLTLGRRGSAEPGADVRGNTLKLAEDYLEQGEYQRALDLLNKLLIENAEDEEARALRDRIITAKRAAEEEQQEEERRGPPRRPRTRKKVYHFEYDVNSRTLRELEDWEEPLSYPGWASVSPDFAFLVTRSSLRSTVSRSASASSAFTISRSRSGSTSPCTCVTSGSSKQRST